MATGTEQKPARQSSLIPYLQKGQGVRLSLLSGVPEQSNAAYPFFVVQDSHPFARLLTADFVTDAGSIVKRVFMLVERDAYRFTEDELFPYANPDLERCWQETSRLIGSGSRDGHGIFLSGQIAEGGGLLPFSPLFFCKTRRIYFHPPCPDCGKPLQLCRDDDLLRNHGLGSWSRSLKRYLNCPACVSDDAARFYAYELEPNDPSILMDRWGLIREFGRLHENRHPDNPFPCVNCSQWGSCYGQGQSSQSRIVPFSFYPFHMLLCEAASFHAMDFLALLSGASLEELTVELEARGESGRVSCLANWRVQGETSGFLYPRGNETHFLELLYLKLSLLLDAFRKTVPDSPEQARLQLGPRIVGLWVDLPGSAGALPWLWSFRTRFVDLLKPEPDLPAMGNTQQGASPFYLGLFWFQALARNRNRSSREIVEQLKKAGARMVKGDVAMANEELLRLFPPGEIFWDPNSAKVPAKFHGHWQSLIRLGGELIAGGVSGREDLPDDGFFRRTEAIREKLRSDLAGTAGDKPAAAGSAELRQIVMDIHKKWQAEVNPCVVAGDVQGKEFDGGSRSDAWLVETVMLSPAASQPEPLAAAAGNDEVSETVILAPADNVKLALSSGGGTGDPDKEEPQPVNLLDPEEEVNLEETVLLIKEPGRGRQRGRGAS